MVKADFAMMVKRLSQYYERKDPQPMALDLWYDRVKWIPAESLDWIAGKITDHAESFPKNLPNMVVALYQQWLDAHPNKKAADREYKSCPDCIDGLLYVSKDYHGHVNGFAFRCKRCDQKASEYPTMSPAYLSELIEIGYVDDRMHKIVKQQPIMQQRNVVSLVDKIVKKVEDQGRLGV